ncbi:DTW domain-containing protein [Vibrio anguillarum]|uniref:tRNA-uridine aminocarboxypropyltransferase n=1 Tax=Vibrio anguillarum TaxID=55601 RepID=A0ABD4QTA0_VIBAN|nr:MULTISPECIES: DTW domain-containing protein [Vibrio]MBT2918515.1 DTW domain-containing protein [Vibrio anguillarum]MCC4237250.1 DTW domain-containing protein [Vibrio anguillarum]MDT3847745.1 DTW domain-containing protein [Vibrio anguillarum]NOI06530.1 DTW domain-containing protein [Vibrio anguillarum]OXX55583.1 DTW domain-containing protein [Vibrio sp. V12_P9A6T4]
MTRPCPCPVCHFSYQCLCSLQPTLDSQLRIALLMHENEPHRATNTGKLLLRSLPNSSVYIWDRISTAKSLQKRILDEKLNAVVIFPSTRSQSLTEYQSLSTSDTQEIVFIILDGTWQEAKKMLNKSPWLSDLPQLHLTPNQISQYGLRRNQDAGHLCTLEVGVELLNSLGEPNNARELRAFFTYYLKAFQADKSGHALKLQ